MFSTQDPSQVARIIRREERSRLSSRRPEVQRVWRYSYRRNPEGIGYTAFYRGEIDGIFGQNDANFRHVQDEVMLWDSATGLTAQGREFLASS